MSKRAEEKALEYADKKLQRADPELWETGYSRYRKMSVKVMDGSDVEEAYQEGYEQAEKDTIERIIWYLGECDLEQTILDFDRDGYANIHFESLEKLIRKAMEEE